jgi:hypothetical protein
MSTTSRCFATGVAILALNLTFACTSSTPLKKADDAAVAPDLAGDAQQSRDTHPDLAGPDLFAPDLPSPDAFLASKDAVFADLPAVKDVAFAELSATKDAVFTDLFAGKDTALSDMPTADVFASDVPAGDVPPADGNVHDGTTDGILACKVDAMGPLCNDDPISEAIMGTCQSDGTCACNGNYVINPSTGRCRYPLRDASLSSETSSANACTGEYNACGCGCCSLTSNTTGCYYPSLGENITTIQAEDQAAKNSADCNPAGCSTGVHYVCCMEAAPESPSNATYTATWYVGDLDHLTIKKTGTDCAMLAISQPSSSANSALKITLPARWGVAYGSFGACGDAGAADPAKGAVGSLALRASGDACVADLHATLFAFTADRTVKSTRLDVDGLIISGASASMCP